MRKLRVTNREGESQTFRYEETSSEALAYEEDRRTYLLAGFDVVEIPETSREPETPGRAAIEAEARRQYETSSARASRMLRDAEVSRAIRAGLALEAERLEGLREARAILDATAFRYEGIGTRRTNTIHNRARKASALVAELVAILETPSSVEADLEREKRTAYLTRDPAMLDDVRDIRYPKEKG